MGAAARTVLVTWYGSFAGAGTIGDLLAMRSAVARLAAAGHAVAHASAHEVEVTGSARLDLARARPEDVDGLVFVCGPIIRGLPQTQALFERFAAVPKLGIGVSLFAPGHPSHGDPFDRVLAREGRPERFEDVALAAPSDSALAARSDPRFTVGIVLRGPQGEYGPERSLHERTADVVRSAADALARRHGGRVLEIENHLARAGLAPAAIESRYAACDLVLSSRFHGAMLALRHGVPFVALDQIAGGAKVRALLGPSGWPHVYGAETTDARALAAAAEDALSPRLGARLEEVRSDALRRAEATLERMERLVRELPPRAQAPTGSPVSASANGFQ